MSGGVSYLVGMDDYSRLDAAIEATLRATIQDLRGEDDSLTLVVPGQDVGSGEPG